MLSFWWYMRATTVSQELGHDSKGKHLKQFSVYEPQNYSISHIEQKVKGLWKMNSRLRSWIYHHRVQIQKYQFREACDDNCVSLKHNQLHRSIRKTKKRHHTSMANQEAQEEKPRQRRLVCVTLHREQSALTHTIYMKCLCSNQMASDYGSHS